MKKSILLLMALVFFLFKSSAQWIEYYQNESVKIEYLKQTCTDVKNGTENIYLFLKISNKTAETIEISYNIYCLYQNGNKTYQTKGDNIKHMLQLSSLQSIEGNCENKQKNLRVYVGSKIRKGSILKEFEVTNIEIKKTK